MGNAASQADPSGYCDQLIQADPGLSAILAADPSGTTEMQRRIWREFMQQSHGSSHVHNAYARMESRMGITLWMVWARMYLPFMFRPVAEHKPSIEHDSIPIRPSDPVTHMLVLECIRELEAAGRPKWDVSLRCKAKVATASFGSCNPSLRGEYVLITVRGFVGEQLIFTATSKLWRYIAERETKTTSDWVLDPTQANGPRADTTDNSWKPSDVPGMVERQHWFGWHT